MSLSPSRPTQSFGFPGLFAHRLNLGMWFSLPIVSACELLFRLIGHIGKRMAPEQQWQSIGPRPWDPRGPDHVSSAKFGNDWLQGHGPRPYDHHFSARGRRLHENINFIYHCLNIQPCTIEWGAEVEGEGKGGKGMFGENLMFQPAATNSIDCLYPPASFETVCFLSLAASIRWPFWAHACQCTLKKYIANGRIMLILSCYGNTTTLFAVREYGAKMALGNVPKPFSKVWRCSWLLFRPIQLRDHQDRLRDHPGWVQEWESACWGGTMMFLGDHKIQQKKPLISRK